MLIDFTLLVYNCVIKVRRTNSVIIMTHQPDWLVDWYENSDSKNNGSDYQSKGKYVSCLIYDILKERCKLRIAGDIHHYMRHSIVRSKESNSVYPQHLLVNGCGGAFTHPTHVFRDFIESRGVFYKCKAAYPSFKMSEWVINCDSVVSFPIIYQLHILYHFLLLPV